MVVGLFLRFTFRGHPGLVVLHFALDVVVGPAERRARDPGGLARNAHAALERLDADPGTPGEQVATTVRSLLAFDSISVVDRDVLLRAVEVYELDRLDFADAYLVACAESTGIGRVASFDRSIDRVPTIERVEP